MNVYCPCAQGMRRYAEGLPNDVGRDGRIVNLKD
jgi:hypothetical protein